MIVFRLFLLYCMVLGWDCGSAALCNNSQDYRLGVLLGKLQDGDSFEKLVALADLEKLSLTRPALQAIVNALLDRDEIVRGTAAQTLGRFGDGARDAATALAKAVKDEDSGVRFSAVVSLGRIQDRSELTKGALRKALYDSDANVQFAAQESLHQLGESDIVPVEELLKALKHTNVIIRYQAVSTFGRIDPKDTDRSIQALFEVVRCNEADLLLRRQAIRTIGSYGSRATKAE